MISGLTNSGPLPVLERMIQFTGQRHQIITNNVANLSTPGFRPVDVDVQEFQAQLAKAIDGRRTGRAGADLALASSNQVRIHSNRMSLNPEPTGENLMFHDGNDRDVERIMQSLVENFMTFRAAAQMFKSRIDTLSLAIRERM